MTNGESGNSRTGVRNDSRSADIPQHFSALKSREEALCRHQLGIVRAVSEKFIDPWRGEDCRHCFFISKDDLGRGDDIRLVTRRKECFDREQSVRSANLSGQRQMGMDEVFPVKSLGAVA